MFSRACCKHITLKLIPHFIELPYMSTVDSKDGKTDVKVGKTDAKIGGAPMPLTRGFQRHHWTRGGFGSRDVGR